MNQQTVDDYRGQTHIILCKGSMCSQLLAHLSSPKSPVLYGSEIIAEFLHTWVLNQSSVSKQQRDHRFTQHTAQTEPALGRSCVYTYSTLALTRDSAGLRETLTINRKSGLFAVGWHTEQLDICLLQDEATQTRIQSTFIVLFSTASSGAPALSLGAWH